MQKAKGFTLVELLVSISIIGIVFGIIITTSMAVQRSSKDAQRQTDLRALQSALQQYYADQQFFPCSMENSGCTPNLTISSATSLTSSSGNPSNPLPSPVRNYLPIMPKDPNSSSAYCYKSAASFQDPVCDNVSTKCNYFALYAKLENSTSATLPETCGSYAVNTFNYKLESL